MQNEKIQRLLYEILIFKFPSTIYMCEAALLGNEKATRVDKANLTRNSSFQQQNI